MERLRAILLLSAFVFTLGISGCKAKKCDCPKFSYDPPPVEQTDVHQDLADEDC